MLAQAFAHGNMLNLLLMKLIFAKCQALRKLLLEFGGELHIQLACLRDVTCILDRGGSIALCDLISEP